MKNNVLLATFAFIVLACLVVTGMDAFSVILKSIIYMVTMGALLLIGVVLIANQMDTEEQLN